MKYIVKKILSSYKQHYLILLHLKDNGKRIAPVKNTGNENPSVRKTNQNRLMLLSNCTVCGKKKSSKVSSKTFF